MSTLPDSMNPSKGSKINISMMLKVPIDLELEVMGIPPTDCQQTEKEKIVNLTENSESQVAISKVSLAKLGEDSQVLLSQIVNQLEQQNIFSTPLQDRLEQDKLGNYQENRIEKYDNVDTSLSPEGMVQQCDRPYVDTVSEAVAAAKGDRIDVLSPNEGFAVIQPHPPSPQKKPVALLCDSVNNGLTLVINTMGTVLFLGKLANYSWE